MSHKKVKQMPKEEGIDQSLSLKREGYMYISNRMQSFNTNVFETRLLGQKAICLRGKEAAELFYDERKFVRHGAAPKPMVKTFFGKKSVQTLDGNAHKNRKKMLMSVMTRDKLEELRNLTKKQWELFIDQWTKKDEIIFYEEIQQLLCLVACEWAGVPLQSEDVAKRTNELVSLFELAASVGPSYLVSTNARNNLNKWIGDLVQNIRNGELNVDESSILYVFATHKNLDGSFIDSETAAVEVLNIIRPIVAVSIYIAFTALAIHQFPDQSEKLTSNDDSYINMFVAEVRRFYPFFPLLPAKVKSDFVWYDYHFKEGTLTLLDLYGTNHDSDIWETPDKFRPDRFANREENPFDFIPQGGGDYWLGHRCAGEWVTIEMMKISLDYLSNQMDYDMPDQDYSYSLVSMPSIPKSKIVMSNIRRK